MKKANKISLKGQSFDFVTPLYERRVEEIHKEAKQKLATETQNDLLLLMENINTTKEIEINYLAELNKIRETDTISRRKNLLSQWDAFSKTPKAVISMVKRIVPSNADIINAFESINQVANVTTIKLMTAWNRQIRPSLMTLKLF